MTATEDNDRERTAPTNTNEDFTDKVAFVTGAASGIGRTTAVAFARAGADVAVADIIEEGVQETAQMIEEAGGQATAVRCDVTQAEDVQAALDETIQTFGGLDFAFNNAGIEQERAPLAEITEEEWERSIDTNLRGMFLA
jgi:NAD(P)-dependent dehydrogenase (short-subunit alcohol dehydrogenase family)